MIGRTASLLMSVGVAVVATGCFASTPTGPCLDDAPATVTIPFARLEGVWWEVDGEAELTQFRFDPGVPGQTTATVAPAGDGPFLDADFKEPVAPLGTTRTSIVLDGLVGGATSDRMQADQADGHLIREIVQVQDPTAFRWVIGTVDGLCHRIRADADAATITLIVSPS